MFSGQNRSILVLLEYTEPPASKNKEDKWAIREIWVEEDGDAGDFQDWRVWEGGEEGGEGWEEIDKEEGRQVQEVRWEHEYFRYWE